MCVWFVSSVCELCSSCCIQHALWYIWCFMMNYITWVFIMHECVTVFYFHAVFCTVLCVKHAGGCQVEAKVTVMRTSSWIKSMVCWDNDRRKRILMEMRKIPRIKVPCLFHLILMLFLLISDQRSGNKSCCCFLLGFFFPYLSDLER